MSIPYALVRRVSTCLIAMLVACACFAAPGTLAKGKAKDKGKDKAKEKEEKVVDKDKGEEKKEKEEKVVIKDEKALLTVINNADAKALKAIHGVGKKLAEQIIAGRPYKALDDLLKVKGIAKKRLDKVKGSVGKVKVPASALEEDEDDEEDEEDDE